MQIASCDNENLSLRPKLTINYKRFNPDNIAPKSKLYINPSIVLNGTTHMVYAEAYDNTTYILGNLFAWANIDVSRYSGSLEDNWNLIGYKINCSYSAEKTSLDCNNNMTFSINCPFSYAPWFCFNITYFYFLAYDDYGVKSNLSAKVQIVKSFSSTTITTTMLREGVVNTAYSDYVYVAGNTSASTWSIDSGGLPWD